MSNHDYNEVDDFITSRRDFLRRSGMGFGAFGLMGMFGSQGAEAAASNPMMPKQPHFRPRANRVVHIFLNGGMSHLDTFDPKPELDRLHGQDLPSGVLKTERPTGAAWKSPFKFQQYGESGIPVSELFSKTAQCVDDMCIIRSMYADVPNHEPSLMLMNCGQARLIRPSVGSWVTYGLGTENQNLPGFVVMCPGGYPIQESQNWQCGFLPGVYQGTYVDPRHTQIEDLIENIENNYTSMPGQRRQLDLLQRLNAKHQRERSQDADLEARIQSYELAYRMQFDATDAFNFRDEPRVHPGDVRQDCAVAPTADYPPVAGAGRPFRAALAWCRSALG